jgi:DNA-binding NarL/FixJ family response regulator
LSEAPIRIVLCDDHAVVRAGLRRLLEDEPGFDVVGEAATAEDAIRLVGTTRPDVVLMDLSLPGDDGISATRCIRAEHPRTHVLVLTMHDDVAYLREAFAAGAAGYVVKKAADVELVAALRTVASGDTYVHPNLGAALLNHKAAQSAVGGRFPELSPRELEVLRLLAVGFTNPEMAEKLGLSVRTIETHRANVQQKLGLRSRAELARLARDSGLV